MEKMMKITHILLFASLLISTSASAKVITRMVDYKHDGTVMKGMIAYDDAIKGKRPGVIVVHEWWGLNSYARSRARQLAKLGYTAFAIDMYGNGKTATHPKDAGAFAGEISKNLPLAKARFEAAMTTLKKDKTVDPDKIAAIGYCFGGGIVLQMARMGEDLKGVASFHGSLASNIPVEKGKIKAEIRVFNGEADPFTTPEQLATFEHNMSAADVNYKVYNYKGAKHSFTNPGSTALGKKFNLPLAYNAHADKDSWAKMQAFFKEIFK
jgi:dienelactone hydrolase